MDTLREQVVLNQFMMTSGCPEDQARKYLQASQWQYEVMTSNDDDDDDNNFNNYK